MKKAWDIVRGLRHTFFCLLGFGLMTTAAFRLAAAESISATFVAVATTIQGNGGSGSRETFFSLPLVQPVAYAGTVTAKESDTITDANAHWTNDQFNGANGSFYVEFDSGLVADITDTDGTAQTLRFPGDLQSVMTVGDSFRIRKHTTISDVFGPNNEAGLVASDNPAEAENVILYMAETQTRQTFFYYNVPGYQGWNRSDYTPAGNVVIHPEQGIMVARKTPGDLVIYSRGARPAGPALAPIVPGFNLVGTLKSAASLSFAELNIYTGNPTTGVYAADNPAQADNLILVGPADAGIYWYCNVLNYEGWYDTEYHPANTVMIPPGSAFFVKRKAPHGAFNWIIPAE